MGLFSGPGVTPSLKGNVTNVVELQAGQVQIIQYAGWVSLKPGKYTAVQQLDPITQIWRSIGAGSTSAPQEYFYSDGQNYRFANQTGCVIGTRVVVAGSGYTSLPTVTALSGNAIFRPIIGGAVSTTVTVTNGGTNYTYPPIVEFSAPPSPGIPATGYCTLTNGAVSSVTIVDQGAGYVTPPTVVFSNDPREGQNGVSQGYNAAAITTLTGAGTITAILVIDHGSPVTGTATPTLTITGGGGTGAAAVTIMDWSITAYGVTTGSSGGGYAGNVYISAIGGFTTSTAAYLNPTMEQNLLKGRMAQIVGSLSGATVTAGGAVNDGGIYPGLPSFITSYNTPPTTAAVITFTMGGQNDVSTWTPV